MCIVKKISIFFIVITFGVTYPMKRFFEKDSCELSVTKECVTFKSLKGFPLTSLCKGSQWFTSLSEKDRCDVTATIVNHNDKRLEALFNIATKVLPELQSILVGCVYHDNIQANNFLVMPIYRAYCYAGYLDILEELAARSDKNLSDYCYNREQLENMVEIFQGSLPPKPVKIYCQYYERFSFQKFIKEDLRYLPFCLSIFITFALPSFNVCGINKENVRFNQVANNFNTAAMSAYNQTKNIQFFEKQIMLKDEHEYCPSFVLYMKIASWLSAAIPLYDLIATIRSKKNFLKDNITGKDLFFFLAISAVLPVVERIALRTAEQPALGASCVTGLYLLACTLYNKMFKNDIKKGWVMSDQIPKGLQRRDIHII